MDIQPVQIIRDDIRAKPTLKMVPLDMFLQLFVLEQFLLKHQYWLTVKAKFAVVNFVVIYIVVA